MGGGGRYQTSGPCLLQHHREAEGGNWEDEEEKGKWRVQQYGIERGKRSAGVKAKEEGRRGGGGQTVARG